MNCEIQNLSRRLVSIHCNSGKTCHLPPGYKHELPEQEITENSSITKLQDRKLIAIRQLTEESTPEPKRSMDAEEVKEEKDAGSGRSSKKKTQTKN